MKAEQYRATRLGEGINRPRGLRERVATVARQTVAWFSENEALATPTEYDPRYLNAYIQGIKDGLIPVFVSNHTGLFDGIQISTVTREAIGLANEHLDSEHQILGAVQPYAKSLESGSQGKLSTFFYESAKPTLSKNKIVQVYTATFNDRKDRGEQKNSDDYVGNMISLMREGFGAVAAFPEGTVSGGKLDAYGQRIGMRPFAEGSSAALILIAKKLRRPGVMFVPIGIDGSWQVNHPVIKWPNLKGFRQGFYPKRDSSDFTHIRVGVPIRSDSEDMQALISSREWSVIDTLVGRSIADLLPEDLKGIHGNSIANSFSDRQRGMSK